MKPFRCLAPARRAVLPFISRLRQAITSTRVAFFLRRKILKPRGWARSLFSRGTSRWLPGLLEKETVYKDFAVVRAAMSTTEDNPRVLVHLQGCSAAGLCYPPTVHALSLTAETEVEAEGRGGATGGRLFWRHR